MSTKNQKQQHVALQMAVAAMATPCTVKLLLFAIPLALGFALGIVATLSLVSSTTSSALPGAALGLFFPPPAANLSRSTPVRARQPSQPVLQVAPAVDALSPPAPVAPDAGISTAGTHEAAVPVSTEGERLHAAIKEEDDDEELMSLAAAAPRAVAAGAPKVAFLFLAKWDLPMAPLWDKFFEGHRGLYSVYVHTDPAFNASATDQQSAFYGRHIPSKENDCMPPEAARHRNLRIAHRLIVAIVWLPLDTRPCGPGPHPRRVISSFLSHRPHPEKSGAADGRSPPPLRFLAVSLPGLSILSSFPLSLAETACPARICPPRCPELAHLAAWSSSRLSASTPSWEGRACRAASAGLDSLRRRFLFTLKDDGRRHSALVRPLGLAAPSNNAAGATSWTSHGSARGLLYLPWPRSWPAPPKAEVADIHLGKLA
ncbi:hypothetical protein ACQ4PT_028650 [Festuca glaucescens]